MPLRCPIQKYEYDACIGCRERLGQDCWVYAPDAIELDKILNIVERVSILEDSLKPISQEPEWSKNQWQYVLQLQGQVTFLQKKVSELLNRKPKKRSRWE